MKIILNGKEIETNSQNLAQLIAEKDIPEGKIAVEKNGEIISKSLLDISPVNENDAIEIITFVGGG